MLRKESGKTEITYKSKKEVDRAIYLHNIEHFKQPKIRETPFTKKPLNKHFGYGATTTEVLNFVNNPHHDRPKNIHPLAKEVL